MAAFFLFDLGIGREERKDEELEQTPRSLQSTPAPILRKPSVELCSYRVASPDTQDTADRAAVTEEFTNHKAPAAPKIPTRIIIAIPNPYTKLPKKSFLVAISLVVWLGASTSFLNDLLISIVLT